MNTEEEIKEKIAYTKYMQNEGYTLIKGKWVLVKYSLKDSTSYKEALVSKN